MASSVRLKSNVPCSCACADRCESGLVQEAFPYVHGGPPVVAAEYGNRVVLEGAYFMLGRVASMDVGWARDGSRHLWPLCVSSDRQRPCCLRAVALGGDLRRRGSGSTSGITRGVLVSS